MKYVVTTPTSYLKFKNEAILKGAKLDFRKQSGSLSLGPSVTDVNDLLFPVPMSKAITESFI